MRHMLGFVDEFL